jgi:membrane fusion protein, multidrug efflux system
MIRKIALAILILVLVIAGLAGIKFAQIKQLMAGSKSFAPPPENVSTALAHEETWQGSLTAIGTLAAVQGVTITPELAGIVREVAFESGAVVAKGDLLVRQDTSSETAQLRALEAQEQLSRIELERIRKLRAESMVAQSELDTAEATMKQNQANADNIRATIEKKTIRAPFAGRLGIRQVNLGQYLDAGKPVASLQALSPIYADFSHPQQELARLKTGLPVRLTADSFPEKHFDGKLTAINPDLDAATRSVGLQATFDNTDQLLRPGMFVRAEILLPEQKNVLVIPRTAVLSAPYGDSVYVIESKPAADPAKPQLSVRQQFIRTGESRGDFIAVAAGLKPGDKIVGAGVFKLRNGMAVVESNEVTPKSDLKPQPSDS